MSKILFTDAQIKKLSKNKWIKNITNKGITYTDEFKYKLVKECENYKKFPQEVFRECNIDPEIVGIIRIQNCAYRWRKQMNSTGEISDTRTTKSGNTIKRELSDKEKLERALTMFKDSSDDLETEIIPKINQLAQQIIDDFIEFQRQLEEMMRKRQEEQLSELATLELNTEKDGIYLS